MSTGQEIAVVTDTRVGAHSTPGTTYGNDPAEKHRIGVTGEIAFERATGLPMDRSARPHGDDGIDFEVCIAGRHLTIDVKTAAKPFYLLIKEENIGRCADILVLAGYHHGLVTFLGWEHKSMMALMPTSDFGYTQQNYFRAREELRPMSQLFNLLSRRDA